MPGVGIQRHLSLCLLLSLEYCHLGRSVRFDLNSAEQPGAAADCFTELHRGDCGSSNKRRWRPVKIKKTKHINCHGLQISSAQKQTSKTSFRGASLSSSGSRQNLGAAARQKSESCGSLRRKTLQRRRTPFCMCFPWGWMPLKHRTAGGGGGNKALIQTADDRLHWWLPNMHL